MRAIKNDYDRIDNFLRAWIDRSSGLLSQDFVDETRQPILFSNLLTKLRKNSEVAMLDAGCGTGLTLFEIIRQLRFRTKDDNCFKINAVGVNDKDYSEESSSELVVRAIKDRMFSYEVCRLEQMDLKQQFDVIWSYETLMHNSPNVSGAIILNLIRHLKDDGLMFVNMLKRQRRSSKMQTTLDLVQQRGAYIHEYVAVRGLQSRVCLSFQKIAALTHKTHR